MLLKDTIEIDKRDCGELFERPVYSEAYEFTQQFGIDFANFVLEKISKSGATNIAIMCNGAEHLGTLLETYVDKYSIPDINFKYLYLTKKIAGPWQVIMVNETERWIQVGYGKKPEAYLHEPVVFSPNNTREEITDYLYSENVFSADELMVVDTGFLGSMVEVIAEIGRAPISKQDIRRRPYNKIRGCLLYHSLVISRGHTIPVHGFNLTLPESQHQELETWTYLIDGSLQKENNVPLLTDRTVFPKSRDSPTRLIKDENGKYTPNTPLISGMQVMDYWATIQGIQDAIRDNC